MNVAVRLVCAVVESASILRAVSDANVPPVTNLRPIDAPAKILTSVHARAASAPTASVRT